MKRVITALCVLAIPAMAADVMHPNKQKDDLPRMRNFVSKGVLEREAAESVSNDPYEQARMSENLRGQGKYREAAESLWLALLNENFIDRIARDIQRADMEDAGENLDELLTAEDGKQSFVEIYVKNAQKAKATLERRLAEKRAAKK
jgi:hypothetical protein